MERHCSSVSLEPLAAVSVLPTMLITLDKSLNVTNPELQGLRSTTRATQLEQSAGEFYKKPLVLIKSRRTNLAFLVF